MTNNLLELDIPKDYKDLLFNYAMMLGILETIANSSPDSTLTGLQGLAKMTIEGLKK